MGIFAQALSLPGLTLAAAIESLVAIKFFRESTVDSLPSYLNFGSHLGPVAVIFLANILFGAVYWGILYPKLFSPLRHIHGPRVSW